MQRSRDRIMTSHFFSYYRMKLKICHSAWVIVVQFQKLLLSRDHTCPIENYRSATKCIAPLSKKIIVILEPGFAVTIPSPIGKIPLLSRFLKNLEGAKTSIWENFYSLCLWHNTRLAKDFWTDKAASCRCFQKFEAYFKVHLKFIYDTFH